MHEQRYVLVCTVRLMTGLRIVPDIHWYWANGSVIGTSERMTVNTEYSNSNTVIAHTLTFAPVLNYDGGVYSCKAQVTVPWMTSQPPVKQASVNMAVISEYCCLMIFPRSTCVYAHTHTYTHSSSYISTSDGSTLSLLKLGGNLS